MLKRDSPIHIETGPDPEPCPNIEIIDTSIKRIDSLNVRQIKVHELNDKNLVRNILQ